MLWTSIYSCIFGFSKYSSRCSVLISSYSWYPRQGKIKLLCIQRKRYHVKPFNPYKSVQPQSTSINIKKNDGKADSYNKQNWRERKIPFFKTEEMLDIFQRTELTSDEWQKIISEAQANNLTVEFCDANIMKSCLAMRNYKLALSYLTFIKEHQQRKPEAGILALFLDICSRTSKECGEEVILSVYNELVAKLPLFDQRMCHRAIIALSHTSEWRTAFKYLQTIQDMGGERSGLQAYSSLAAAAFRSGDMTTGWKLMEDVFCQQENCNDATFGAYFSNCKTLPKDARQEAVQELLQKLGQWRIYMTRNVAQDFSLLTEEHLGWTVEPTTITRSGVCRVCKDKLSLSSISPEDYTTLTEEFLARVLKRGDVFLGSTPEELARFQAFLSCKGPFTQVLDGLNVAYLKGFKGTNRMFIMAKMLLDAVEQTYELHKASNSGPPNILVVGRFEMDAWHQPTMQQIYKKAHCYFVNRLSKDDSFFLYAALHSGIDTHFITSDLLRDHRYKMSTSHLQRLFSTWQGRSQIFLRRPEKRDGFQTPGRGPIQLEPPTLFTTAAQQGSDGGWHIPHGDDRHNLGHDLPTTWLCAKPAGARAKPAGARDVLLLKSYRRDEDNNQRITKRENGNYSNYKSRRKYGPVKDLFSAYKMDEDEIALNDKQTVKKSNEDYTKIPKNSAEYGDKKKYKMRQSVHNRFSTVINSIFSDPNPKEIFFNNARPKGSYHKTHEWETSEKPKKG